MVRTRVSSLYWGEAAWFNWEKPHPSHETEGFHTYLHKLIGQLLPGLTVIHAALS